MPRPLHHRYLFAFLLAVLLCGAAAAEETLRVLAWPGYADVDVVRAFEQRTGARVEVTLIDSDEVLWQRVSLRQGADFDVFAVNTAELQRYIASGLVVPIDADAIHNRAAQLPRFRDLAALPGVMHDGKAYAIPYTYAAMGLIYDRRQVDKPPATIAALWDPRYKGKVLAYRSGAHNFALAAQKIGARSPFRLDEGEWPAAVDALIALRRNVLTFYSQPEESAELFVSRRAALLFANYGPQQLQLLRAAGADVGYVLPDEGALTWLDCWVVTRGARDRTLAAAWIDYLLEAGPSEVLTARHGLANTRMRSPHHADDSRLAWLEPVEDAERRNHLWERILSGDRASRVLAP
ncbi:extracellular solute-binding protein [Thauera sinica]|uniref:Extracellular solute-binding protein n=1 Tax=Thauera sinica TaxID=2665146 RepID=A0ABW1AYN5_9RHOO|nr:extracellular solute-binding protein [Thauera sp. K11]ATE60202.1 spermidine/putrescine ABC transporter substrate-binding protein [Thauera sp. K11]